MQENIIQKTETPKGNSATLFVAIILLLLISNVITAYFLLTKDEVDINTTVSELVEEPVDEIIEEETVIPELQTASINEPINLGQYTVTLLQVIDPVDQEDVQIALSDGYRYVAIEILIENNTDSTISYSTDWTLYDSQDYDYSTFSSKQPRFVTTTNIPVNGTSKGWLNFRILEESTNLTVKMNEKSTDSSIEFILNPEN